jgi:hypothetical protein
MSFHSNCNNNYSENYGFHHQGVRIHFFLIKYFLNNLYLAFSIFTTLTFGQPIQTAHFEIQDNLLLGYLVEPCDEKGVIIYSWGQYNANLQIIKLDSSLNQEWAETYEVPSGLTLIEAKYHKDKVYFLFQPEIPIGEFHAISVSLSTSLIIMNIIKTNFPFQPVLFEFDDQSIVVAGYYKERPIAVHHSIATGHSKLLTGFMPYKGIFNQLAINKDGTIDFLINFNTRSNRELWFVRYSVDGVLQKNTIIKPTSTNIIFARFVNVGKDSTIVAGIYGRYPKYSRGVFAANINPDLKYSIRYYNFGELKNFFSYLDSSDLLKVKKKVLRKKMNNEKVKLKYRVVLHNLLPYQNHFILLAESVSIPDYNGDEFFEPYQYTHSIVLGIDRSGKLLWDNSFEMNGVGSQSLHQIVHHLDGASLNLIHSFKNKFYFKKIAGTEVIQSKKEIEMVGKYENDKIKDLQVQYPILEYWYGKNLLFHCIQEIHNDKDLGVELNRKVFCVSKITIQD